MNSPPFPTTEETPTLIQLEPKNDAHLNPRGENANFLP